MLRGNHPSTTGTDGLIHDDGFPESMAPNDTI
jgi:hypothetical protein